MAATTPENKVKRKLDRMLKAEAVWFFSPQSGPYGVSGIPDRILCLEGLFVGVECKADRTKKPTALQELRRDEIVNAGGKWFLVYDDATIGVVREFIASYRRQTKANPEPEG